MPKSQNKYKFKYKLRSLFLFSLTVFIVTLAGSLTGWAQTGAQLHGKVVDEHGAAVAGAIILLAAKEGGSWSAVSDAEGGYTFNRLAAGDYLLKVEANSFGQRVTPVSLTASDDHALDITLPVAAVSEELVVTAAGTPQSIDELSKSVDVIDAQQIEQRDETSLVDAVRPAPGLTVESLGGPGSFSKIFIRGLRVVDTSVLVDGFRVRDASDFRGSINPFLEDMLTNNIGQVEVLRGSGSSLYGTNAVGGVINIVPVEGAGPPRFDLGFEGGGMGFFRERAGVSGGIPEKLSYSVSGTRLDVNDGVQRGEVYRNTSVGGRVRYNFKPNMSLRVNLNYSHGFNLLSDPPFPIGPAGNPLGFTTGSGPIVGFVEDLPNPGSFRFADMFTGSVAFQHQVTNFYDYSLSYQAVVTNRKFASTDAVDAVEQKLGVFGFAGTSNDDGRIYTFDWTNNIRLGRNNLVTTGLEQETEFFTQDFTSPFFSTPRSTDHQKSLAFFVQDQMNLRDGRLHLSAAFRTEGFSLNNPESVPEVQNISIPRAETGDGSIAYRVAPNTKLRSHVGNSFRAPSLSERFSLFRGVRIGNPSLVPERAISVDGGIDQYFLNNRVRASATYFYSHLQSTIGETALFAQTNMPGAISRGVELSVNAAPRSGLTISGAYTFVNSSQVLGFALTQADGSVIPARASTPSFSIPRHTFSLQVNQQLPHGFDLNFALTATSKENFPLFDPVNFNEFLFTFDGYTKADVNLAYTRSLSEKVKVTLNCKVSNIFNQRIIVEGFRAPNANALAGIKFRF